ncbi:hypothetical protein RB653_002399 [Dictyostelium firmibasis]
MKMKII